MVKFIMRDRNRHTGRMTRKYIKSVVVCLMLVISAFALFCYYRKLSEPRRKYVKVSRIPKLPLDKPIRPEPERFPANTHMPPVRETVASGAIDMNSFLAERDLIRIDDSRVWWESDNDVGDDEDDHEIHKSMEEPLRRLIELVCQHGGTLKVHDAYRYMGIHVQRSLHKEGRAVDVTCNELSEEKLAKLCWVSGFDWVYYEKKKNRGVHIHCSVRK